MKLPAATTLATLLLVALTTHSRAGNDLDKFYQALNSADLNGAFKILKPLADQGFPEAQYMMGRFYQSGYMVKPSLAKSLKWYERAALNGNAIAQVLVGNSFREGVGRVANLKVAADWYQKASENLHPHGAFFLGMMRLQGRGIPRSDEKSMELLALSRFAHGGDVNPDQMKPAFEYLKNKLPAGAYERAIDKSRSVFKAKADDGGLKAILVMASRSNGKGKIQWLRKAADGGNVDAIYKLAMQFEGKERQKLLQRAGDRGNDNAIRAIGLLVLSGGTLRGKNWDWLISSAESGNETAQRVVATIYSKMLKNDGDFKAVEKWFLLAFESGDTSITHALLKFDQKLPATMEEAAQSYVKLNAICYEQSVPPKDQCLTLFPFESRFDGIRPIGEQQVFKQLDKWVGQGRSKFILPLAQMMLNGIGTEPDIERALKLLEFEATKTNLRAIRTLARWYGKNSKTKDQIQQGYMWALLPAQISPPMSIENRIKTKLGKKLSADEKKRLERRYYLRMGGLRSIVYDQDIEELIEREATAPSGTNNDFLKLLQSANVMHGEKIARKCKACHTFDKGGRNKVGPNLWNIVDRKKGKATRYKYSKALSNHGGQWSLEDLDQFLYKPRKYMKGTKMSFRGIKSAADRIDLIAYLRTMSDGQK